MVTKLLFYLTNVKRSEKINALFIATPLSSLRINNFIDKKNIKTQISNKKVLSIEILGIIPFLLYTLSFINLITNSTYFFTESLIILLFNLFFLISLLYFSIHDILRMKIPESDAKYYLLAILAINIFVGIYRFVIYKSTGENVLNSVSLGFLDNLVIGLLLYLIIYAFNKLNKKNFGIADMYLVLSFGLILGFPAGIIGFIVGCILAGLFAILYIVKIKRYKGVRIPFAPFLLLGYVIAIGFSQYFIEILQKI